MREMRRILSLLMAIIMTISLMGNALAAERAGLDNFTRKNSYRAGQFSDVKSADWFAGSVKKAYELGLVKGASASSYNPNGNITVAETLALACRLREIFFGGTGTFEQGATWYQVYVDYAIANDMITSKQFRSYTATATRAEVAAIMAKALPSRALSAINVITDIPDVNKTADYADAVYLLYNAGILTGSDSYGTFYPSNSILRSEIAAIVTRMADQSERKMVSISQRNTSIPEVLKIKGWSENYCPTITFKENMSCHIIFNMAEWMLDCSGLYEVYLCNNGKRMMKVDLGKTVIGDGKEHKINYFYLFEKNYGEWDYYGENIGFTLAGEVYVAANMKQINVSSTLLEQTRIRDGVYCSDENVMDDVSVETVSSAGDISFSANWYRTAGIDAFGKAYGNIIPFFNDDYRKTYGVLEFVDESVTLTLFESGLPYIDNGSYTYSYVGMRAETQTESNKSILLMSSGDWGWVRTGGIGAPEQPGDMYLKFYDDGTFVYWVGTGFGGEIIYDKFYGDYSVNENTLCLDGNTYDLYAYTAGSTTMSLKAMDDYALDFSGEYFCESYDFLGFFPTN